MNRKYNGSLPKWAGFILLALLALVACIFTCDSAAIVAGGLLTALPFMICFDKNGEGGGGAPMPEGEFQKRVLDSVDATEKAVKEFNPKFEDLDKKTKQAIEDLTTLKNKGADFDSALKQIQKVNLALSLEKRAAFGDPIQRISGNAEKRGRFNAAVRMAQEKEQLAGVAKAILAKALGEDATPGSTLITPDLADDIYDTLARYGKWSTLGVRRLGTRVTKFPVKTARPQAQFLVSGNRTMADDANKAGTSVDLTVELIGVLLNVARELLEDAEYDVTADVMDDFVEAFNERLDYAAFMGAGTANGTHGGMTGIFNSGVAAVAAAGNTTIETLDFEDVAKCLLTVDPGVLSRPCRWWAHPSNIVRLLSVKDANGRSIFLTALEAPAPGALGSILGYPVELVHIAPSTNAASAKVAAFGDPQAQVVGIRKDFAFEASDDAKWNTYERSFRGVGRAGTVTRRANGLSVLTLPAA